MSTETAHRQTLLESLLKQNRFYLDSSRRRQQQDPDYYRRDPNHVPKLELLVGLLERELEEVPA